MINLFFGLASIILIGYVINQALRVNLTTYKFILSLIIGIGFVIWAFAAVTTFLATPGNPVGIIEGLIYVYISWLIVEKVLDFIGN